MSPEYEPFDYEPEPNDEAIIIHESTPEPTLVMSEDQFKAQAQESHDRIIQYDLSLRENFLKLGQEANAFEQNQFFTALGYESMQDYLVLNYKGRAKTHRNAMRITAQLALPFDALSRLSRESMNLLLRLPPEEREKPAFVRKWSSLAEKVDEEEFEEKVRERLREVSGTEHVETPRLMTFKVPDSVKQVFEDCVEMARALNIKEGHGAATETAIARICHVYREAEADEHKKITEAAKKIPKAKPSKGGTKTKVKKSKSAELLMCNGCQEEIPESQGVYAGGLFFCEEKCVQTYEKNWKFLIYSRRQRLG